MFPLGGFIGWDKEDKTWFELLTADATFLHIAAFAAGAFIDTVWYQQEQVTNPEATLHYLKEVRMLREKLLLQDEGAKLSDSTVSVILTLANCAYNTGEYETGRQHLEGLLKIAKLRGGLATFRSNNFSKKLLMEMLR
jgi:hypothetical protein